MTTPSTQDNPPDPRPGRGRAAYEGDGARPCDRGRAGSDEHAGDGADLMSAFDPLRTLLKRDCVTSSGHLQAKSEGANLRYALLAGAIALASTSAGYAQKSVTGTYLCTVVEKAGIGSLHLEGAGPPAAFVRDGPATRFKMRITPNRNHAKPYRLIEIAYEGSDRDQLELEDENSVLHSAYLGNGTDFYAVEGRAFLTLFRTRPGNSDGDIGFYHAGF
jgi:hypothetical protein